jgi:hypothetical protein
MAEAPAPATSADIPRGAILNTAYAEREVKVFGILESEARMISTFNTLSTTFFSVSSGLASIAIGIWVNGSFSEKATPAGDLLAHFAAPALCVLAVVFLCLAIWARISRGSTWDTIQRESKTKTLG